jgi:hypothetical protein
MRSLGNELHRPAAELEALSMQLETMALHHTHAAPARLH